MSANWCRFVWCKSRTPELKALCPALFFKRENRCKQLKTYWEQRGGNNFPTCSAEQPAPSQQSRTCDFCCSLTGKFWPVSVELFVPLSCKSTHLNSSLFAYQLSPSVGPRAASILSSRSRAHIPTSAYCLTTAGKVLHSASSHHRKTIRRNRQEVLELRNITQLLHSFLEGQIIQK